MSFLSLKKLLAPKSLLLKPQFKPRPNMMSSILKRYYSDKAPVMESFKDDIDLEDGKEFYFERFSEKIEKDDIDAASFRMYGTATAKRFDLHSLSKCIKNRLGVEPRWVGQRKVKNTLYCRISSDLLLREMQGKIDEDLPESVEFFWFKDGTMVTYGSTDSQIEAMHRVIKPSEIEPLHKLYYDQMSYVYNNPSGINFETDVMSITSHDAFLEKLTSAHCLRRSIRLDVLEDKIDELGRDISQRASDFFLAIGSSPDSKKMLSLSKRAKTQHIFTQNEIFTIFGTLLRITSELNDDELKYPPEYLWDSPQFERLYELLEKSFMIKSRFHSANESLEASKKDIELVRDHFNVNHSFRLEVIIIILIFVEVIMTLLEKSETYSRFTWGSLYEIIKESLCILFGQ